MRQNWNGQDLVNLITLTVDELVVKYPNQSRANLERRKQEKTKDQTVPRADLTQFDKLLERSGMRPDEVESVTRMNMWQGFIKNADGEIEPVDQYAMQIKPKKSTSSEVYEPVAPAIITPTKRKPIIRNDKLVLIYGDGQVGYRRRIDPVTDETEIIPTHNIAMHNIIKQINAEYMPETTVNLGDFADFPELSHFDPDSDHYHKTLGMSMRYIHDFYAQFVTDNPTAHHVEVDSNHAVRVRKQILSNIPALYDFVRPGGDEGAMLTYYYLANLGKLRIDFISGYGGAEFVYGSEYNASPVIFKHGNHSSSSAGSTVKKESSQNPDVHVIRGHGHNDEQIMVTRRNGNELIYKQFGSACINNGPTPGYASAIDDHNRPVQYHNQGHQNTFGVLYDHQDGTYDLDTIIVRDGKATYRGREYNGNE